MTDEEILAGYKSEYSQRVDRYLLLDATWKDRLQHHVIRNTGTDKDGQDIVIETLTLFRHNIIKGKYRKEGSLENYFLAIGRLLWLKELRNRRRHQKYVEYSIHAASAQVSEQILGPNWLDELEHVEAGMQQLSEQKRKILILAGHGFSHEEIAKRLGLADARSSRTTLKRARKDLRQRLGGLLLFIILQILFRGS